MNFLTVRHFHDENALLGHGQNGPLKQGQEDLVTTTVEKIIAELQYAGVSSVKIVSTSKTLRHNQTTELITKALTDMGINVSFQHDVRMEVMDQGDLILPDDYQDGDWFTPLDVAWDAICDEAYLYNNIFYRFGDHLNGKYPVLAESFARPGQSMGWSIINKYSLIYDLIRGNFSREGELLVIVSQSDLPLLLLELQALEGQDGVTPENLPYKCWEVYKSGLQDIMYDNAAIGAGNFDIPMGHVGKFSLSSFITSGFDQVIQDAKVLLAQEMNKCYEQ